MTADVSAPVIRELKTMLVELALATIGQHLWSLRIAAPDASACLCDLCGQARKSYQFATGLWPTMLQEHSAMADWGNEKR